MGKKRKRVLDRLDFTISREKGRKRAGRYGFFMLIDRIVNPCRECCSACTGCSTLLKGVNYGD